MIKIKRIITTTLVTLGVIAGLNSYGYWMTHTTTTGIIDSVNGDVVNVKIGDNIYSFYGDGFNVRDNVKCTLYNPTEFVKSNATELVDCEVE